MLQHAYCRNLSEPVIFSHSYFYLHDMCYGETKGKDTEPEFEKY